MAEQPLAIQHPSKILAVHVSYRSRAMERGRLPLWPSYFLKPPSTLAADGDPVRRPPWCELLAFEGEVALVIGTRACRVSPAGAWDCVRWVTAANDFGVYDLRYADRGSNVRSKGIDGFTPLGPRLIDAHAVAPAPGHLVAVGIDEGHREPGREQGVTHGTADAAGTDHIDCIHA